MNVWFTKNLGDAMLAGEALDQIEVMFLSEYGEANIPKKAGVFFRHDSEGRLHCEVKVYFTPEAEILAKKLNAEPCKEPSRNGLSLLIGSACSWLAPYQ